MNKAQKELFDQRKFDKYDKNMCLRERDGGEKCRFLSWENSECILYYEDVGRSILQAQRCAQCAVDMSPDSNAKVIKMLKDIKRHLGIR